MVLAVRTSALLKPFSCVVAALVVIALLLPSSDDPSGQRAPGRAPLLLLTVNHDNGRLGNKMFKYASLLGVARANGRHPFVNPYEADLDMARVFNLTHVELHDDVEWGYPLFGWSRVHETQYAYFDPVFRKLPSRDISLRGWMQSWKYFDLVQAEVRKEFTLVPSLRSHAENFKQEIRRSMPHKDLEFVAVHVRHTDQYSVKRMITCVAPKSFYVNAFNKMRTLLPDKTLVFVVAGNNLTWCKENILGNDVIVLPPQPPEVHFAVLSSCDHGIVSVGTYGWWAAWLTGGHVIYYTKFPVEGSHEAIHFVREDYYPPAWIAVDD
ncbi:unnamed protein product [Lymnaea stagnalis]|uniref:L-Fucosyltransferase n=1 Tax=Lymnaea stagnalis TaxID=6523 RepID=A0AAV2HLB1_LYMST